MQKTKTPKAALAWRRWGRWLLALWLLLVVWGTVEYMRLPDVRPLLKENPRTTALMEQRAEEAREAGRKVRQRQTWVALAAVPRHVQAAILLSEDARFYEHDGVDWVEVEGALEDAWEEGELGRGASTLTQQLAKNLYLSTDRSLLRKAKEYVLAKRLEDTLPKQRILTLYVNVVEWGEDVYGIEAAARAHFGVSARGLSVAQGAMLASMLPAPRRWVPALRPPRLRKRAGRLIDRLERFQRITPAQATGARAELARFFGEPVPAPGVVPAPGGAGEVEPEVERVDGAAVSAGEAAGAVEEAVAAEEAPAAVVEEAPAAVVEEAAVEASGGGEASAAEEAAGAQVEPDSAAQ